VKAGLAQRRTDSAPHLLVLGAGGQLGQALVTAAGASRLAAIGLTRQQLDVTDRDGVIETLRRLRLAGVINAAAYTAVDRAESEPERAFAVNRDGAGLIAEACAALDIPLLHVSTDYVFDGTRVGSYREDDAMAPLSVYGVSKAEGEALVRRHQRAAVVRTSWLFGAKGNNFVKTILRLAGERPELRVVADQHGCPTATDDLAAALIALADKMRTNRALAGVFHYAGAGAVSWHEFAETIVALARPLTGHAPRVVPIATQDYPTAARRPRNSVLACARISALGIAPTPWQPSLATVIARSLATSTGQAA
jgi:dTDP-4-dehydrorhamnose reductase